LENTISEVLRNVCADAAKKFRKGRLTYLVALGMFIKTILIIYIWVYDVYMWLLLHVRVV
jgi:hypothetical protein